MIEVENLTKRYRGRTAVDNLSFTVRPGLVTGFLGPNGAGKTTTMRLILGLDHPTSGRALVAGKAYRAHAFPAQVVGAVLDVESAHPNRTAAHHLQALAAVIGAGRGRVDDVLGMVGLGSQGGLRVKAFSLGMRQRLGIAAALLGDPEILLLDEPVNGLDPDGVRWIRRLLRDLAGEGRTVFVSSHLMAEMSLTADHLVILGKGQLIADVGLSELLRTSTASIQVRTPAPDVLRELLQRPGVAVTDHGDGRLVVTGMVEGEIAGVALANQVLLHELTPAVQSLEDTFMELTRDAAEHSARNAGSDKTREDGP